MIAVEADAAEQVTPNSARADLAVLDEVEARYAHWHPPAWATLIAPAVYGLTMTALVMQSWWGLLLVLLVGIPVQVLVDIHFGRPRGTRRRLAELPSGSRRWLSQSHFVWIFIAPTLMNLEVPHKPVLACLAGLAAAVHVWFCLRWSRTDADD